MTAPSRRMIVVKLDTMDGSLAAEVAVSRASGGLALHRTITGYGIVEGWTVTHIASGWKVGPVGMPYATAQRHMKAMLALGVDWTQSNVEAIRAIEGLKERAHALYAIARAEIPEEDDFA